MLSNSPVGVVGPSTAPAIPHDPRGAIAVGLATIALVFGGLGTWAALAPIASAVIAPGVVTVESNRKKVQHLDGGIVKELLVRDGKSVQVGDVLVRLDETQARSTLAVLRSEYDAAAALEARLLAESNGLRHVEFPSDLIARSAEPTVAEVIKGQESQFQARRSSIQGQTAILRQRIAQLNEQVRGALAQERSKEEQIALLDEELASVRSLLQRGYVSRPRLLALERDRASLDGERGEHASEVARAKTSIAETELQILQLQRDFREKVVEELRSVQTRVADLSEKITAARHVLEHIEIRAPVSGTAVGMEVHTVGGVIRPGETILEVVPDNDTLIIEVQVQPRDIDSVVVGQAADVRFPAFKAWMTPSIVGTVAYVSADRIVLPQRSADDTYYVARISVSEGEVARLGDRQLYPGMPAEAMIRTGERTTLEYLAQPFFDRIERAWREE